MTNITKPSLGDVLGHLKDIQTEIQKMQASWEFQDQEHHTQNGEEELFGIELRIQAWEKTYLEDLVSSEHIMHHCWPNGHSQLV